MPEDTTATVTAHKLNLLKFMESLTLKPLAGFASTVPPNIHKMLDEILTIS